MKIRLLSAFLLFQVAIAQAAVIEVNTPSGDIAADDGCSLPEAIANANDDAATFGDCVAGDGADQIEFNLTTPATIVLSATPPQIDGDVSIVGPGMDALSISGNNAVRLFSVRSSGSLTLSDIELTQGTTSGTGGAISSGGPVMISRTRFLNNSKRAVRVFFDASLTVVDSEFIGNSGGRGGAITSQGDATVSVAGTLFQNNSATSLGGAVYGQNRVALTVRRSLFVNNTSGGDGGAIASLGSITTIETSTFSGNSARRGAVYAQNADATMSVSASTFTDNTSRSDGAALTADAGAITVSDSLIMQGSGDATLCAGDMTSNPATISSGDCFGATVVDEADVILLPLADNGGLTQTHALGLGSVAIDAIADCGSITEDQRGRPRPSGPTPRCDAGAFERQRDPPVASDNAYNLTENDVLTAVNIISDDTGDGIDTDVNGDALTVTQIAYVDDNGAPQTEVIGVAGVTVTLEGGGLLTLDESGAAEFDARGQYDQLTGAESLLLTFSYTLSDGDFSDDAVVELNIAGVNDAPITVADTYTAEASSTLTIDAAQGLLSNDSDVDGGALMVTSTGALAAGGIGGTFNINEDGSFSYDAPDAAGTATAEYTMSDGEISVTEQITVMVTASTLADLQISKSDGVNSIRPNDVLTYSIVVTNNGPADVLGALVEDIVPASLSDVQWICVEDAASLCANQSGSGDIVELVDLASGSELVFELTATVNGADGPIENVATVSTPTGITDPDLTNNSATDVNRPDQLFRDGFESEVMNVAFSKHQAAVSKVSIEERLATAPRSSGVLILRAASPADIAEQVVLIHARSHPVDGAIELQTSRLDNGQWTISEWAIVGGDLMMLSW
ncbi:MAG: choice-of-anchor Q domain-containing protein [Lysobacterales bacterium]